MAIVEGFKRVAQILTTMASKDSERVSVSIGYKAKYALWVHEAPMTLLGLPRSNGRGYYWDPLGKARRKYLEGPAREFERTIADIVRRAYQRGATIEQSLVLGGLRLQRESQKRVPVDLGNLKGSAFTEVDKT